MLTPAKWIVTSITLIVLLIFIAHASSSQNITTRTTSQVEVLAETISVGVIRSELNEDGKASKEIEYVDTDELIANLTTNVVKVQKNHPYDIQLEYVFLDDKGNVTTEEKKVRGIQFRVQLIDDKGGVKGTAERRLALNQLES